MIYAARTPAWRPVDSSIEKIKMLLRNVTGYECYYSTYTSG